MASEEHDKFNPSASNNGMAESLGISQPNNRTMTTSPNIPIHGGAVPVHVCEICKPPKTFTRVEHLRRHQLSHPTPGYPCQYPGCDRAFYREDLLARHKSRHDQEDYKTSTTSISSSRQSTNESHPNLTSSKIAAGYDEPQYQLSATDSGYGSAHPGLHTEHLAGIHDASKSEGRVMKRGSAVHSYTRSLHRTSLDNAIFEIAQEIATIIPPAIERGQLQILSDALPGILEEFSFRIGREDPETTCCRLMYLVHRYNDQIVNAFVKTFDDGDDITKFEESEYMPIYENLLSWFTEPVLWDESEDPPKLQEYSNILLHSPAYAWLQGAVHRTLEMAIEVGTEMHRQVRQTVFASLHPASEVFLNPKLRPTVHTVQFVSPWITDFLESQGYPIPWSEVLPQIIVLTGSRQSTWASTVLQYLSSVWPVSGPQLLGLLQTIVDHPAGKDSICTFYDGTEVYAYIQGSKESVLHVRVYGTVPAIMEIGTILIWLCGALSASINKDRTTYARPGCTLDDSDAKGKISLQDGKHVPVLKITQGTQLETPAGTGTCWTALFGNPVVVTGFMTPRRQDQFPGCEMPLSMMAALADTRKISNFGGRIMIKGFSTALIPTGKNGGCIMWHVVTTDDGSYISFTDCRIKNLIGEYPSGLTISDLQTSRHIVGWCSKTRSYTGARSANYDINWSGLKTPLPGCAFDKVSIVGGQFITGGVSCILGKKDKPVHIRTRDDYTMRLKWMSKKFVVLYDVIERRSWLVDGVSALLHLVRASLKRDSTDAFQSHFLFQESALQEAPSHLNGKAAAIDVLINRHNTSIPLYSKPDSLREEVSSSAAGVHPSVITRTKTDYCIKDRVESICDVLEQIMNHQADVTSEDGVGFRVKLTMRRQLEGFDFMDLATDEDPFWPRLTTLQSKGKGWVDFARAIHAITLFGSGFGNLIRPVQSDQAIVRACSNCNANIELPKLCDYLAVCVSDIEEIIEKRGSRNTTPWRLVDDIYWHAPEQPFDTCRCDTGANSRRSDRVQVLLPASLPKLWARGLRSPQNLPSQGALLFGHNMRFLCRWGDKGDPQVDQPDDSSTDELDTSFRDSGLGTSLGSSSDGAAPGNSPGPFGSGGAGASAPAGASKHPRSPALLDGSSDTEEMPSDSKRRKLFDRFLGQRGQ